MSSSKRGAAVRTHVRVCGKKELDNMDAAEMMKRTRQTLCKIKQIQQHQTNKDDHHCDDDLESLCKNVAIFNMNRHSNPVCVAHVPLMETIPKFAKQYVLGRVTTLERHGYHECTDLFNVLNLEYAQEQEGYDPKDQVVMKWTPEVNDMFLACAVAENVATSHLARRRNHITFPIRMILDASLDLCSPFSHSPSHPAMASRRRVFTRASVANGSVKSYDREAFVSAFGVKDYAEAARDSYSYPFSSDSEESHPSVTIREVCQLLFVYGYRLFQYVGEKDFPDHVYFFQHPAHGSKPVPPQYVEIKCFVKKDVFGIPQSREFVKASKTSSKTSKASSLKSEE